MPRSAEQLRAERLVRACELLRAQGLKMDQAVTVTVSGAVQPGRVVCVNPLDGRIGVMSRGSNLWVERSLVKA